MSDESAGSPRAGVRPFPGFGFSTPLPDHPDMNFWKVADLWHTLMTQTLGYDKYAAAGCDVGALVTGQFGHKYADELYAIHIGSGLKLTLFNGDRAWDLSGGRPIPEGLPAGIHARIFVGYENPPGVSTGQRVQNLLDSDRAAWYNHVNLSSHDHGGHFIPWEIPDQWVDDLRRTFRGRR